MNEDLMKLLSQLGGGAAGQAMGVGALGAAGMAVPWLPLAEGGINLISSFMKQKKATQAKQAFEAPDPTLSKYMGEIDRQRKSFETGSAYGQEMKELKNQQAAVQMGITRLAKGNTGSALQALSQSGLATGRAYGDIAAKGQERQDMYTKMYGDMISRMEQRGYERKAADYYQASADARDARIKGLQTLLNTLSLGKNVGKGTSPLPDVSGLFQQMQQQSPEQYYDLPQGQPMTA